MLTPELKQLCDTVRETSFSIHRYLRNGHLEKVYQNALVHRLGKQGFRIQPKHPLNVYDEDGTFSLRLLRLFAASPRLLRFIDQ